MGQERQKIGRECVDERLFFDLETSEFKVLLIRSSTKILTSQDISQRTIDHTHYTVHSTVKSSDGR